MARKKKKIRTIQDIIDDIREQHDKEETLLSELGEKTEESDLVDEGDE